MNIKIVAAIVDTQRLLLYREDGETISIKQGDPRLRTILDQVTPQIVSQGYAEITLEEMTITTGFEQFEKQSGVVRFFKVAREKLANLFTPQVEEAVVGKKPETDNPPGQAITSVIEEIISHAQPVTDSGFNTDNINKQGNVVESNGKTHSQCNEIETTHTVVAHVDGKLIPNMERIETHFVRAAKLGSTKGVERFLQRLASVIDKRSHSVEDLLKFKERADMPIADDGSIVAYKVLRREGDHYVDCHTRKVPQKVGSYVCMDISLVDRHRNNECSNGLHIARRGYLRTFSGDVCVIVKVAPEDVVTVPSYDANKMRVMGYHILAELPQDLYDLVRKNQAITETAYGKELLGRILAGDHVKVLEEVHITRQNGNGVIITPRLITKVNAGRVARGAKPIPSAEALSNPENENQDTPINPKDVVKKVTSMTRKEQAQKLFKAYQKSPTKKNKDKLFAFKRSVKLGWVALGIDKDLLK